MQLCSNKKKNPSTDSISEQFKKCILNSEKFPVLKMQKGTRTLKKNLSSKNAKGFQNFEKKISKCCKCKRFPEL